MVEENWMQMWNSATACRLQYCGIWLENLQRRKKPAKYLATGSLSGKIISIVGFGLISSCQC